MELTDEVISAKPTSAEQQPSALTKGHISPCACPFLTQLFTSFLSSMSSQAAQLSHAHASLHHMWQILSGTYVDSAHLLQPSARSLVAPRKLPHLLEQPSSETPCHHIVKNLCPLNLLLLLFCTATQFVPSSVRAILDDYLSIVLDLALKFGGTGFYSY